MDNAKSQLFLLHFFSLHPPWTVILFHRKSTRSTITFLEKGRLWFYRQEKIQLANTCLGKSSGSIPESMFSENSWFCWWQNAENYVVHSKKMVKPASWKVFFIKSAAVRHGVCKAKLICITLYQERILRRSLRAKWTLQFSPHT